MVVVAGGNFLQRKFVNCIHRNEVYERCLNKQGNYVETRNTIIFK